MNIRYKLLLGITFYKTRCVKANYMLNVRKKFQYFHLVVMERLGMCVTAPLPYPKILIFFESKSSQF